MPRLERLLHRAYCPEFFLHAPRAACDQQMPVQSTHGFRTEDEGSNTNMPRIEVPLKWSKVVRYFTARPPFDRCAAEIGSLWWHRPAAPGTSLWQAGKRGGAVRVAALATLGGASGTESELLAQRGERLKRDGFGCGACGLSPVAGVGAVNFCGEDQRGRESWAT